MVIDASARFARRTAQWMLTSGFTRQVLEDRLKVFNDDHVKLIGEQVRDIKGQNKNPK